MKKVCVIIPVHSPTPSLYELISFRQCFNILHKHEIKIIAPKGLSLIKYKEVVSDFQVIYINPKWQTSLITYNKLKTSRFFYNLFTDYKFMLTYELDSFIFKDELDYWCDVEYDYVGAPWFEGFIDASSDAKIIGVGNSGFSLRNIQSVLKVLKNIYYKNPSEYESGTKNRIKSYLKFPYRWTRNRFNENYTVQNNFHYFEDIFFSYVAPAYFSDFKLASAKQAMKFSFEVRPEILFEMNNRVLPMGCHAWWRYNLDFWRPHIESYGFTL